MQIETPNVGLQQNDQLLTWKPSHAYPNCSPHCRALCGLDYGVNPLFATRKRCDDFHSLGDPHDYLQGQAEDHGIMKYSVYAKHTNGTYEKIARDVTPAQALELQNKLRAQNFVVKSSREP